MATAEQLKSLIQSHFDRNEERFKTTVLQLAAYEASLGHNALARDIRAIIDKSKYNPNRVIPFNKVNNDLVEDTVFTHRLTELVVPDEIKDRLVRIIHEFKQQDKLRKHGLSNRRKILLTGPPGTGKTMTASVLAGELSLPLYTIQMDRLITKFMGETSTKLRKIFDMIKEEQGIYLFDEFDAIGSERSLDNDVGEMRRVVNSFLQFIDMDNSSSLIVAATNNPKLLDQALFRRFDDVLNYKYPGEAEIKKLIVNKLGNFIDKDILNENIIKEAMTLNHAEISRICDDAIKETILNDKMYVDSVLLLGMIYERNEACHRRENF